MSKKNKVNTAWYLWSRFLNSPFFLKFKLCGNAQSLMMHIVRLMDAKLSKYGTLDSRKCEVKITELCRIAGMTDKPASKYIDQLLNYEIINIVQKLPRNIAVYRLGRLFSDWENLRNCEGVSIGDLDFSFGDSPGSFGEIPKLYKDNNTNNKTNNNNRSFLEDEKKIYRAANPSPLLENYMLKNNTKYQG